MFCANDTSDWLRHLVHEDVYEYAPIKSNDLDP